MAMYYITEKLTMKNSVKIIQTKVARKIGNRSKQAPKVDPEIIARAFDATAVAATHGLDLLSLRDAIASMITSHGGRPSIDAAGAQVKIPRIDEDWRKLERITRATDTLPHRPSITQAAALVLHVALARMSEEELEKELRRAFE